MELKFVNHITNNIDIYLEEYFTSEKFLNMIYEKKIEDEKNTVQSNFFEALGYMFQRNETLSSRRIILNYINIRFETLKWNDICIIFFSKFVQRAHIILNKITYNIFHQIFYKILSLRLNSKSNQLKLTNLIVKSMVPLKTNITEEDFKYLECFSMNNIKK